MPALRFQTWGRHQISPATILGWVWVIHCSVFYDLIPTKKMTTHIDGEDSCQVAVWVLGWSWVGGCHFVFNGLLTTRQQGTCRCWQFLSSYCLSIGGGWGAGHFSPPFSLTNAKTPVGSQAAEGHDVETSLVFRCVNSAAHSSYHYVIVVSCKKTKHSKVKNKNQKQKQYDLLKINQLSRCVEEKYSWMHIYKFMNS